MRRRGVRLTAIFGPMICASTTVRTSTIAILALVFTAAGSCRSGAQNIGYLESATCLEDKARLNAFKNGLVEAGVMHAEVVYRCADNSAGALPKLVEQLTQARVSVIFASTMPAILAAKTYSTVVPIVFATSNDPVRWGLVETLAKPGGRLTGVTWLNSIINTKRVEMLLRVLPEHGTLGVLANRNSPSLMEDLQAIRSAAKDYGYSVEVAEAGQPQEIDAAVQDLVQRGVNSLFVLNTPLFLDEKERVVQSAASAKLPAIYFSPEFVRLGGLMSYGASIDDAHYLAGIYTAKIIQGISPSELPVLQATRFASAINIVAARSLGLTLPYEILAIADEVIE